MSSLVYVHIKKWIKGDIIIENVSLNFDPIWKFKYENSDLLGEEGFEGKKCLKFSETRNLDINALIGKNGAGKSTILNFIRQIFFFNTLMSYDNENNDMITIEDEVVIVVKDKDNFYKVFAPQNPLSIKPENIEIEYVGKAYAYSKKWFNNSDNPVFYDTDFIYFSNIFSHESDDLFRGTAPEYDEALHDISMEYYLKKDNEKSVQALSYVDNRFYKIYEFANINRIFEFLIDDENKTFTEKFLGSNFNKTNMRLFVMPLYEKMKDDSVMNPYMFYIYIKAQKLIEISRALQDQCIKDGLFQSRYKFMINVFNNSVYTALRVISKYNEKFCNKQKNWQNSVKIKNEDHKRRIELLIKHYGEEINYHLKDGYVNIDIKIGDNKNYYNTIKTFFGKFIKKLKESLNDEINEEKELSDILQNIYDVFLIIIELGNNSKWLYLDETGIDVDIIGNKDKLRKLFSEYRKFEAVQSFIILKLGGFSSGEEAFLNMFSRFYELENDKIKKEDLIIMMDEPEVYFHPEWQRKVIYTLISYFENKKIYKDKNIQVILTSNTPYLISDLPNDNIHFINSNKNDYYNIIGNIDTMNDELTFGANIHTLLKKSFFMESTIGEFSRTKINDVINFINGKKTITNEEALHIINLIGEPIIRNKLLRMYEEKYICKDKDTILIDKEKYQKVESVIVNDVKVNKQELLNLEENLNQALDLVKLLNLERGKDD